MRQTRVALITHDLATGGGTATMTRFLYGVLKRSEDFTPRIVSLATANRDRASVLAAQPWSWTRSPRVLDQDAGGLPYRHVGARFPEFEFQRYVPRQALRQVLSEFDILQFVTGVPSWACAAGDRLRESLIWFATTVRNDRASRTAVSTGLRRLNSRFMTSAAESSERKALRGAGTLIALSNYSAETAQAVAPGIRPCMIPCGIDTNAFRPAPAGPGNYVLCVGRMSDARKNVRLLIEAWNAAARNPAVPDLYLVGEPPDAALTAEIRRSENAARIHTPGLKRGEELAEIYRNAMMLVVPSDEEGLGIVILEAMASGVPVVSTRCGGPETAVVDGVTGFLTPRGDASALRDAILAIAGDHRLRNRLGEAALCRAREVFSVDSVGSQFLDLYRTIAPRN